MKFLSKEKQVERFVVIINFNLDVPTINEVSFGDKSLR